MIEFILKITKQIFSDDKVYIKKSTLNLFNILLILNIIYVMVKFL